MTSGTFTVEATDNPAITVGETYPLTIDEGVTLSVVTSTSLSADPTPATVDGGSEVVPAVDPGSVV